MSSHGTRKLAALLGAAACCLVSPVAQAQDPFVDYLASEVSQDEVTAIIQTLEGFGTRHSYTTQCNDAADWLYDTLQGLGIEVEFEDFEYDGHTLRNVIGRIEGSVDPTRVFIVGAHYDSTSESPLVYAPGADDNASGVAAVLEAARILSKFESTYTLEFILFGGEEQGRRGSIYNAQQAAASGKNIMGMINLDMIGYWPSSSDLELDIGKNGASAWLADVAEEAATTYASIPVHNWPDTGVCYDDHVSYWPWGVDAIVLMDCYEAHYPGGSGESTPYYHTTLDTIATLDLAQTTEAVRATVAAMALLAQPLLAPLVLHVDKVPSTEDVSVTWGGNVPPYTLEACTEKDFSTDVITLTPTEGTAETEWLHPGALNDGLDYYYRVSGLLDAE